MGTSGSFGGSGGKDAKDLRDSIADWLADSPAPDGEPQGEGGEAPLPSDPGSGSPQSNQTGTPTIGPNISSVIRLLNRRAGGGDGPGGGGGRGGTGSGSRSGGGVRRSAGSLSRAAGNAGALARAYASGDRAPLERAGLDYDELAALGDPVQVGLKIVEAAFDTSADSTIADSEERIIAAEIVEWILESPAGQAPSPNEIVRKSIEAIIAEVTLTELGDTIRAESSPEKRRTAEQEIRDTAEVYANRVDLSSAGASDQEIAEAIEGGITQLGAIFGVDE